MIYKLFKKVSQNSFAKDTIYVSLGTIIAQIVTLAIMPILTRRYSPESFGNFAIFIATLNLLLPIANLRYPLALVLPENENDARVLVHISLFGSLIISGTIYILLWNSSEFFKLIQLKENLSFFTMLLPFGVFFWAVLQTLNYWLVRHKLFFQMGLAKIVNNISVCLFQILLCSSIATFPIGLELGFVSGALIAELYIIFASPSIFLSHKINLKDYFRRMYNLAISYKKFPLYMTLGALLDTSSISLTPILLSKFCAGDIVGFFGLAQSVINAPISLLGRAISFVYLHKSSELKKYQGDSGVLVRSIVPKLFVISGILTFTFFIFSPILFSIIFGTKWHHAGLIARALSPIFFFQFVANALSSIFIVEEKLHSLTKIQFILLVATVMPFALVAPFTSDPMMILAGYSACQTLGYLIYVRQILKIYKISIFKNKLT